MHKWYVVQVLSGKEKKTKRLLDELRAERGLEEQVPEILLPTENVSEVKAGERRVTEKRIWPGYLLVKMVMNDDTWQYVKETNGVIDFLGGSSPTALTDREVERMIDELKSKQDRVTEKHSFQVGSRVKITEGVFVNFIGTVTSVNSERGRLNAVVSIFGRDTQVDDLELWQVEEILDDEEG